MSDARKAAEEIDRLCAAASFEGWSPTGMRWHRQINAIEAIIAAHSPAYAEGRRAGLLEAAKVCEDAFGDAHPHDLATTIRTLAKNGEACEKREG